mgnify:CR=1 FL=1
MCSKKHEPENLVSADSGFTRQERCLRKTKLPHDLNPADMEMAWAGYQAVIGQLLIRMGTENRLFDSMARVALVSSLDGVYARLALIPKLSSSAIHAIRNHGIATLIDRVAGECMLMELSAAAGYRTFCFPALIKGLMKTGKMKDRSVDRMMDTFEFLNTMMQHPFNDSRVLEQIERTNELHSRYKVAGAMHPEARNLFKYIALNMFYIGPMMRPDLTPRERHAICGLTVLVAQRMGHIIEGSVLELEAFIADYEATRMFGRDDDSALRQRAVEIAKASKKALDRIPTILPARIHGYVPYRVKKILELE